jgi:Mg-chelatase subunit ChlI
VEGVSAKLVAARPLDDAKDPAGVTHARVCRWIDTSASTRRTSTAFIAGLIPRATGIRYLDVAWALDERLEAMQQGHASLQSALSSNAGRGYADLA